MNAHADPIRTAADLRAMLDSTGLPPLRHRDMASAINRISALVGSQPAHLTLDVPILRRQLAAIRPAAHGISAKTLANLRALFVAALEWAGRVDAVEPGLARRDVDWSPLAAAVSSNKR